ncbi:LPAR3 protein, partial [Polyodon spathula]|nr:LPAR3 protein [Polyodon spathula]
MNECHYDQKMEFFYNHSNSKTEDDWSGTRLIIILVFGSIFCVFIFLSNAMVIAAVITNKRFHFPFYYLLANLAASDFFAGIAYVYLMFNTGRVFVICWTPGLVVLLLDGLHCSSCGLLDVKQWFLQLAMLNSIINPIIYSYKDEEMRNTFWNMISCGINRGRISRTNSRALSIEPIRSTEESSISFHKEVKA